MQVSDSQDSKKPQDVYAALGSRIMKFLFTLLLTVKHWLNCPLLPAQCDDDLTESTDCNHVKNVLDDQASTLSHAREHCRRQPLVLQTTC